MKLSDFFPLVTAVCVMTFAAITVLAIVSIPFAVAVLLWQIVFA